MSGAVVLIQSRVPVMATLKMETFSRAIWSPSFGLTGIACTYADIIKVSRITELAVFSFVSVRTCFYQ